MGHYFLKNYNHIFKKLMKSLLTVSKKAIIAVLTCTVLLISGSASAQSLIKGKVVESDGTPVIGASVIVTGTNNGSVTDVNGVFELNVAAGTSLEVSCIGFSTQTVKAANGMTVTLEMDTTFLDEVVVVGYGVQRKSDVTGAVARVESEALNSRPVNNAFEALQGKVAGVDITSNSRPGELGKVLIRGQRSISASSDPLYVVDGVPLQSGGIESINPRDIESIDVLKDASSTAIYGSRGANGVIIVTTKRGKEGKLALNYTGTITVENLVDKAPAMSASDYLTWERWAKYNADQALAPEKRKGYTPGNQPVYAQDQDYFTGDPYALANINKGWEGGNWDPSKVTDTDWTGMVTRTGITHEHTLSASAGTEKVQAFASFGYLNNQGTQKGQDYERFNLNVAVDIQATKWFKMGASINGSFATQKYGYSRTGQATGSGPVDIYSAAKNIPRYTVPYDDNGEIITNPGGSVRNVYTVVDEWTKSTDNRQIFRGLGNVYGLVDFGKIISPLEGLTFRIAFGPDFRHYRQGIYIDSSSAVKMGSANYAKWGSNRKLSWTFDQQINYAKTLGKNTFNITLLHSSSAYNNENGDMSEQNVVVPSFLWNNMGQIDISNISKFNPQFGTGYTASQMESYMARVNYNYDDRYLLTVSGRYDGASVLASGRKWAFFPSAALGWRISQEDFMSNAVNVDQLKLRAGVGMTGNSAVSPYGTLGVISSYYMPFSTGNEQIFVTNEPYYSSGSNKMPNPNLSWEKTLQFNYGLDFSFFKGRIGGTVDVYHSQTNDLLLTRTIPSLTGYPSMMDNIGKTKNFGVEFTLNAVPVKVGKFEWLSNLNMAYQKDEIVELSNGKEDDINNAWFIGESIAVHYGYENAGIWQESDQAEMDKFNANGTKFSAGTVRPVDQNGDYKIDASDRVILGNKNPRFTMGWVNTFTYGGLELSVDLYGRFGYMISTGGEGQICQGNQRNINYWTPDNPNADWQKPVYGTSTADAYAGLLGFKKASFVKLRNISLAYNFAPKSLKKAGISNLKLYVQAKNLGDLFSTVNFYDLDLGTYYYNRGFTFGVQIGF